MGHFLSAENITTRPQAYLEVPPTLADEASQKQLTTVRRNDAIRTKAHISKKYVVTVTPSSLQHGSSQYEAPATALAKRLMKYLRSWLCADN